MPCFYSFIFIDGEWDAKSWKAISKVVFRNILKLSIEVITLFKSLQIVNSSCIEIKYLREVPSTCLYYVRRNVDVQCSMISWMDEPAMSLWFMVSGKSIYHGWLNGKNTSLSLSRDCSYAGLISRGICRFRLTVVKTLLDCAFLRQETKTAKLSLDSRVVYMAMPACDYWPWRFLLHNTGQDCIICNFIFDLFGLPPYFDFVSFSQDIEKRWRRKNLQLWRW